MLRTVSHTQEATNKWQLLAVTIITTSTNITEATGALFNKRTCTTEGTPAGSSGRVYATLLINSCPN